MQLAYMSWLRESSATLCVLQTAWLLYKFNTCSYIYPLTQQPYPCYPCILSLQHWRGKVSCLNFHYIIIHVICNSYATHFNNNYLVISGRPNMHVHVSKLKQQKAPKDYKSGNFLLYANCDNSIQFVPMY